MRENKNHETQEGLTKLRCLCRSPKALLCQIPLLWYFWDQCQTILGLLKIIIDYCLFFSTRSNDHIFGNVCHTRGADEIFIMAENWFETETLAKPRFRFDHSDSDGDIDQLPVFCWFELMYRSWVCLRWFLFFHYIIKPSFWDDFLCFQANPSIDWFDVRWFIFQTNVKYSISWV